MDSIFHEKQEGSLCAQHCLNALLQGTYYTAVDLANIAKQLDEEERKRMAESRIGTNSEAYKKFVEEPSSNLDDSGFFSIQVIAAAISTWDLEILSYKSSDPRCISAKANPNAQKAFICNMREHWFTIRKLGNQWFNLNSLLTGPELISDTYLKLFLAQLETEGYSIHVVCGKLPDCIADQTLKFMPAIQTIKPRLINIEIPGTNNVMSSSAGSGMAFGSSTNTVTNDQNLQAAMAMSLADHESRIGRKEDDDLQLAMLLSIGKEQSSHNAAKINNSSDVGNSINVVNDDEELQLAIAMSLNNSLSENKTSKNHQIDKSTQQKNDVQGTEKPKKDDIPGPLIAIKENTRDENNETQRSPTPDQTSSTPDIEEVRRRRLAFLQKLNKKE